MYFPGVQPDIVVVGLLLGCVTAENCSGIGLEVRDHRYSQRIRHLEARALRAETWPQTAPLDHAMLRSRIAWTSLQALVKWQILPS